jgi:hypothetical protein
VGAVALALLATQGCGGDSAPDPRQVLSEALSSESLLSPPINPAEVEVASLGFQDAVLERQILRVDRQTNKAILEALAGSDQGGERGLASVIEDLTAGVSTRIDGVAVDRVSGSIDVRALVDRIRPLAESQQEGETSEEIPGVGQLDQLEESLVAAEFEILADQSDGAMRRFSLILALDDPANALPPSRIRFSLPVG